MTVFAISYLNSEYYIETMPSYDDKQHSLIVIHSNRIRKRQILCDNRY